MGGEYGLSFSGSASSGADLSGAVGIEGGGAVGSITYGPGSVVTVPASVASLSSGLMLAGLGAAALFFYLNK
jgi:hypothetical protein